ncbi:MAG: dethiobiotin synthase [Micromonosporaceae bacterium]
MTVAPVTSWRGPVLVTGTDTGVGKTIVTAALSAVASAAQLRVAVLKPAQTGEDDDAAEVARLAAPATVKTLARYPDPLAPLAAARTAGTPPLAAGTATLAVRELAADHDLVLIEGAGGLLVPMGVHPASGHPWTVADLAVAVGAPAVVVVRAGLGTLNHTALTIEALQRRGVPCRLVIGGWPREPQPVHRENLTDLARIAPLDGRIPEAAGALPPPEFRASAPSWFEGLDTCLRNESPNS